jgi:hypothetical protein
VVQQLHHKAMTALVKARLTGQHTKGHAGDGSTIQQQLSGSNE